MMLDIAFEIEILNGFKNKIWCLCLVGVSLGLAGLEG